MIWVYSILWLLLLAYGIAMLISGNSDISKRQSKIGIFVTLFSAYLLYDYFKRGIDSVLNSFFSAMVIVIAIVIIVGFIKFIIDAIKYREWELGLFLILGIMLAVATHQLSH